MISGIAVYAKAKYPDIKIIGAEPEEANDAYRSKRKGKLLKHDSPPQTVADGLKTTLGTNTWPVVRDMVDEIITVKESEIVFAMRMIWERMKLCIEPSAGVGYAAVLSQEFQKCDYRKVGVVLCGGNIDLDTFSFQRWF